jgi:hypothetical protein
MRTSRSGEQAACQVAWIDVECQFWTVTLQFGFFRSVIQLAVEKRALGSRWGAHRPLVQLSHSVTSIYLSAYFEPIGTPRPSFYSSNCLPGLDSVTQSG